MAAHSTSGQHASQQGAPQHGAPEQASLEQSSKTLRDRIMSLVNVLYDNLGVIIVALLLLLFVALLQNVLSGDILRLDAAAYQLFVVTLRNDWMTYIMEGFSNLASPVVLVVMLLVVAAFAPGKAPGFCATANLGSAIVIDLVLKEIIQRPRPDGFRLISETGYSFPSGHSMVAMAFYGLLIYMIWHYEKNNGLKWLFCVSFSLVVILIGVSRIYLGVHYASDVLAGFAVALAWILVYTRIFVPMFMDDVPEWE